jgi:acyl-CoA synthetase (AMP-forming)/AMP-acid ligase II
MQPLSNYRTPQDPFLLRAGGAVTAAEFFAQAHALADALPGGAHVINLCETRHGFLLGYAAALMRGQISLLPPGRGRGDWEPLLRQFPGATVLSDEFLEAERFFDLSPFLADREVDSLRMPQIDGAQCAAILFTSGSTGQPAAHPKSWEQLWRGAAHLSAALHWGERSSCAVVGGVSPQHMFGLEATVMLPWYGGVPVHAQKPLLAADIEIALRQCARPCWWMTTAVQLRAPLKAATALEGLDGILASTMNVPAALAAAAEAAWKVPVMEIYGSTETGALAIRRTARKRLGSAGRRVAVARGTRRGAQALGRRTACRTAGAAG